MILVWLARAAVSKMLRLLMASRKWKWKWKWKSLAGAWGYCCTTFLSMRLPLLCSVTTAAVAWHLWSRSTTAKNHGVVVC